MVTAYSPLARGKVPTDATIREIGEAHGKSAGQVALRWLLDKPNVDERVIDLGRLTGGVVLPSPRIAMARQDGVGR